MFNYSEDRGQISPEILARFRVEAGDDEQRDVARFLQLVNLSLAFTLEGEDI